MLEEHQVMYDMVLHSRLTIRNNSGDYLQITRVIGGWLYEYLQGWDDRIAQVVFVPEPLKKEG